jgi:Domain of unknown function (DUF4156)
MRLFCCLLALVLFAGCVKTSLAPQAERVQLTLNRDEVKGCRPLGNVEASQSKTALFFGQSAAQETVRRRLRNDAAKMGGNFVVVASSETSMTSTRSRGEAYACS